MKLTLLAEIGSWKTSKTHFGSVTRYPRAVRFDLRKADAPCCPVEDGFGNIMAVVDAADGAIVAKYDHGPYGEVLGMEGEADACPFRYQSKFFDGEAGLYYFGYRYYSPKMGRWLSRDPMGEAGGFNLYAYCGGDPVNKWDYLGLDPNKQSSQADFIRGSSSGWRPRQWEVWRRTQSPVNGC